MGRCDPPLPRRALLVGAACGLGLAPLTGCRQAGRKQPPERPDPLEPVLATAVSLADRYHAAVTQLPALAGVLTPLREAHRVHALALRRELGTAEESASPAPGATDPSSASAPGGAPSAPAAPAGDAAAVVAGLRESEQAGHRQAAEVCLAGPGYRAALLGSIAAARASHAEILTTMGSPQ